MDEFEGNAEARWANEVDNGIWDDPEAEALGCPLCGDEDCIGLCEG